ncbi:MAG: diguanylate cyclase [Acetobacterium sp.]|nr:diguanylate cyclase [Acetobacterium sp.]
MEPLRKKYRQILVIIILILGGLSSLAFLLLSLQMEIVYKKNIEASIIEVKKNFLKDNVDNLIITIEQERRSQEALFARLNQLAETALDGYNTYQPEDFLEQAIFYFEDPIRQTYLTVLIADPASGRILYSENVSDLDQSLSFSEQTEQLAPLMTAAVKKDYGRYQVFFGVRQSQVEDNVEQYIREQIHASRYSNDAYFWINEVVNYEGGDNYGIRLIHPNLKDTEGQLLSTSMTDIQGNYPYLEELEGVKGSGEIFYTYFFKKLNSDVVSEKLTYARLYPDYNWIVAMGVHLDDISTYVTAATAESRQNSSMMLLALISFIISLIVILAIVTNRIEAWYYRNSEQELKAAAYQDTLTQTYNRRAGNEYLEQTFKTYKITGESPAFIMIDIDDFKKVNDQCGHDVGDQVLIKLAAVINQHIRSNDKLYRWGGEEFLLVCQGLKEDDIEAFTTKLLAMARSFNYGCDDQPRTITISMGVSYYIHADSDEKEAIKRADLGLYEAKKTGKNRSCYIRP